MKREQHGQIIRIGDHWYVRYWEKRAMGGRVQRKRVTHQLGPITGRSKYPPDDIKEEAKRHMNLVNGGTIPPDKVVSIGDFVETVFLPWITKHKKPSTAKGYRLIWQNHLALARSAKDSPQCREARLRDTETHHVQGWLDRLGLDHDGNVTLGRNTMKHVKAVVSAIFTLAKQQGYFKNQNPAWEAAINPDSAEPAETYAYDLTEIETILSLIPEPAATAFAVSAFAGLRHGEIEGVEWPDLRDGELHVERNVWDGKVGECKTRKSRAAIPVIRQLAERLELHRLRSGNPQTGPIFQNSAGKPLSLGSVVDRHIWPALNVCAVCRKRERDHLKADHPYQRDESIPQWHGWHAARRGLGSNLYRLGVPDKAIQRILRHAHVSTTLSYYVKSKPQDALDAMAKLEKAIPENAVPDTQRTPGGNSAKGPTSIQ